MNQMFKLVLEKAKEPEIKLPTSVGSLKKQEFQKNIYFCLIDYAKDLDFVDHKNLENSSRDGNTRPPDLLLRNMYSGIREICIQEETELDMEQQTDSKSRKEYVKAVYSHPGYLSYMQSTS